MFRTKPLPLDETGVTGGCKSPMTFILAQSFWLPGQESLRKDKGRRRQGGHHNHLSTGCGPRACVRRLETEEALHGRASRLVDGLGVKTERGFRNVPKAFGPRYQKNEVGKK